MQITYCRGRLCTFLIAVFLLKAPLGFSQTATIDSLEAALQKFESEKNRMGSSFPKMRDTVQVKILADLAYNYAATHLDKAFEYAGREAALSKKINYAFGQAHAFELKAYLYECKADYNTAIKNVIRARQLYAKMGTTTDVVNADNYTGVLYGKQGLYNTALKYLFRGLEAAKKANHYKGIANTYSNIGLVYSKSKDYDNALKYNLKSLDILLKQKITYTTPYTYMNIGEIYGLKKQNNKAIEYYKRGIESAIKNADNTALANNYCGLGIICFNKGEYELAKEQQLNALSVAGLVKERLTFCIIYLALGEIYLKTGEPLTALNYTLKAKDIVTQSGGEIDMRSKAYGQLASIYEALGNYKQAFENHRLYKQFNDSVFNDENRRKLTEQRLNYEFKGRQEKKDLAAKEALQRQKNIRNATVGGLTLLAVSTIWLLVRRYRKNMAHKQQENESLQEELTVKELEAQALKVEKENIALKNKLIAKEKAEQVREKEELQQRLDFKRRELASATLYLYQKNELLSELKAEIEALPDKNAQPQLTKIKSTIQQNLYLDADWEKFKLYFERVHPDFFKDLNEKHPGLTVYEVRLCAYLHLKLSTKEIAGLLNITPASVTKAKVRLNKKLNKGNDKATSA